MCRIDCPLRKHYHATGNSAGSNQGFPVLTRNRNTACRSRPCIMLCPAHPVMKHVSLPRVNSEPPCFQNLSRIIPVRIFTFWYNSNGWYLASHQLLALIRFLQSRHRSHLLPVSLQSLLLFPCTVLQVVASACYHLHSLHRHLSALPVPEIDLLVVPAGSQYWLRCSFFSFLPQKHLLKNFLCVNWRWTAGVVSKRGGVPYPPQKYKNLIKSVFLTYFLLFLA